MICRCLLPSVGFLFILLTVSLDTQKFSIWIQSNLSFFFLFYWSGLPFPAPGDLPDPGIKPASPALAGGFFTTEPPRKPHRFVLFGHAVLLAGS